MSNHTPEKLARDIEKAEYAPRRDSEDGDQISISSHSSGHISSRDELEAHEKETGHDLSRVNSHRSVTSNARSVASKALSRTLSRITTRDIVDPGPAYVCSIHSVLIYALTRMTDQMADLKHGSKSSSLLLSHSRHGATSIRSELFRRTILGRLASLNRQCHGSAPSTSSLCSAAAPSVDELLTQVSSHLASPLARPSRSLASS